MSSSTYCGCSGRGPTTERSPLRMLSTCGSSSRCEPAQDPAERRDARVVLGRPLVRHAVGGRAHRAVLQDREAATVTTDSWLTVEEGARGSRQSSRAARTGRSPGTPATRPTASATSSSRFTRAYRSLVQLADVEHQRTRARARRRAACPATPRRSAASVRMRNPASCSAATWSTTLGSSCACPREHEDRRILGDRSIDERLAPVAVPRGLGDARTCRRRPRDARRRPRARAGAVSWSLCPPTTTTRSRTAARICATRRDDRAHDVPGDEDHGAPEHDEAGQQRVADERAARSRS